MYAKRKITLSDNKMQIKNYSFLILYFTSSHHRIIISMQINLPNRLIMEMEHHKLNEIRSSS